MFLNGAIRLFGAYMEFVGSVFHELETTPIPEWLIIGAAFAIPVIQFIVGLFLIFGYKTKFALSLGFSLMIILIAGKILVQDWAVVDLQMLYVLIYFILLERLSNNAWALDIWIHNRKNPIGF